MIFVFSYAVIDVVRKWWYSSVDDDDSKDVVSNFEWGGICFNEDDDGDITIDNDDDGIVVAAVAAFTKGVTNVGETMRYNDDNIIILDII